MKKLISLCLGMLLLSGAFANATLAQGASDDREPVFAYPFQGPFVEGVESPLKLKADGGGGFYLLTDQRLFHWSPGDLTLAEIGRNENQLWDITCNAERMIAFSIQNDELYSLNNAVWESLGKAPWINADAEKGTAGPVLMGHSMTLGADRLFFFSADYEQERVYFCTYLFETKEFFYEEEQVFSREWCVYDEENDILIGIVGNAEGKEYLASYDYKAKAITIKRPLAWAGLVVSYDLHRDWVFVGGFENMLVGPNDDEMKAIPGVKGRTSVVTLDATHFARIKYLSNNEIQEVGVYEYGVDELISYTYD